MKYNLLIITFISALILVSCGQSELETKRKELDEAKKAMLEIQKEISTLEEEIAKLDTTAKPENAVLVAVNQISEKPFVHKVKLRGTVSSRRNVMVSAETAGRIESVNVREGQNVQAGQVLITLDANIIRRNIAELKTSLELATTIFEKQERLWDKKIGTEVQYLEAKNNKASLENKLATANAQLARSIIKAPFSGRIDNIPAKVGEMAQPGIPLVRLVSPQSMYVEGQVSERFVGAFNAGDSVLLYFPIQEKSVNSKVTSVGDVINEENRTFTLEASLDDLKFEVKPNQVVSLELTDYFSKSAIKVPSEIILSDANQRYLYVAETNDNKLLAKKRIVRPGKTFGGETEILEGLNPSDKVILDGYRDITDGSVIKISDRKLDATAQL